MPTYWVRIARRAWENAERFIGWRKTFYSLCVAQALALVVGVTGLHAWADTALWALGLNLLGFGFVYAWHFFHAPGQLDAERAAEIRGLNTLIAASKAPRKPKPPLPGLQVRSDTLRQLVRNYRTSHDGERVLWFSYVLPDPEQWQDYEEVVQAWEAQYGVEIVRRDTSVGYTNVKFKLPRLF